MYICIDLINTTLFLCPRCSSSVSPLGVDVAAALCTDAPLTPVLKLRWTFHCVLKYPVHGVVRSRSEGEIGSETDRT